MEFKDFKDKFQCEIYKLDTITTQNNFILYDNVTNSFNVEISLIMVFDILKEKNIRAMFEIAGINNGKFDIKLLKNLSDYELNEMIILNQKQVFHNFKMFVLLSKINITGIDIKPENKRISIINGKKYLNIYQPKLDFETIPISKERNFYHIEILLKNILGEGYEFFLKLLSWKIQFPLIIIPNHWIIQDDGGTGKTEILINEILDKIFNISIIGQGELQENYTDYMKNKVFIIAEEIEGFSNEKKIKQLTGSKKIRIREMYKSGYDVTNYNTWIILSNDIKPLKIGLNDRRFNVVGGGLRIAPDSSGDWSKTLFKSKEGNFKFFEGYHKNIKQEIINLVAYLKSLSLNRQELQQTLNTKHKRDLEEINYTSEFLFIEELSELNLENFVHEYLELMPGNFLIKNIISKDGETWIKSKSIYTLYSIYCKFSNLKQISKFHFFRRLHKTPNYNTFFGKSKVISFENKKFQAINILNKN